MLKCDRTVYEPRNTLRPDEFHTNYMYLAAGYDLQLDVSSLDGHLLFIAKDPESFLTGSLSGRRV